MKLSGIVAAIIAAATAIIPITFNSPSLCAPYTAFAEDTGAVAVLPDWIPTDFDSAVNFRNTYGATHIENGLICIVYPQRVNKDSKEGKYGYDL